MDYTSRPMSMYFKYSGKARPEIKSASTFDAILAGERTATTRFPQWYRSNPQAYEQLKRIEPGTRLSFMDTQYQSPQSRVVTVQAMPTKLSGVQGLGGSAYELSLDDISRNPQWLERWSEREGWSPNAGLEFFRKYGKGLQIPFEVVGNSPIATPVPSPVVIPRKTATTGARVAQDLGQQYQAIQDSLADLAYAASKPYGLGEMASSYYP